MNPIIKSILIIPNKENIAKNARGKYLLLIEQGKQQNFF
jgi:hypothetical protein